MAKVWQEVMDNNKTPWNIPLSAVHELTYPVGRHELGVKIIYVTGTTTDPANKGYRIWYNVIAQGETPPENLEDLRKSFYNQTEKGLNRLRRQRKDGFFRSANRK